MAFADVPDQQNGEINESKSKREAKKCNICKAFTRCCLPCQRLYKNIADDRPRITEEDDDASFWNARAKCSRFSLLFPFVTALLFVADVGMDCEIAATHYSRGDSKWAAYTLAVIVFSLIITDALSAIFFLDDQKDEGKTEQLSRNDLEVKPWFYAFHFIFCGRLIRCVQIFRTVRFIRKIQSRDPRNTELYRLYISQRQDSSTLGVVEAFTEEAPQVALQLYILFQKGTIDWTSFADLFVAMNVIKSLALFAFSLLSFCRLLRLGSEQSQLLEVFSLASVFHFSWRLFMLVSRILALVLFASNFQHFVFVAVGIHLLFSYFLLRRQPDKYFEEGSLRDILLRCAFICINVFCFFPLEGERTRNWGIPYYLMTFTENSIMVLLWYFLSDFDKRFKMIMLITEWGTFLLGLVSVLLYYGVFHPSLKVRKNKEKSDVADAQSIISFEQFESSV